jgi:hypothetical protein
VVIWPEMLGSAEFEHGLDMPRLAADYQAFTGRVFGPPKVGTIAQFRKQLITFIPGQSPDSGANKVRSKGARSMEKGCKYTPEFKSEPVRLVVDTSRPIAEVGRLVGGPVYGV